MLNLLQSMKNFIIDAVGCIQMEWQRQQLFLEAVKHNCRDEQLKPVPVREMNYRGKRTEQRY